MSIFRKWRLRSIINAAAADDPNAAEDLRSARGMHAQSQPSRKGPAAGECREVSMEVNFCGFSAAEELRIADRRAKAARRLAELRSIFELRRSFTKAVASPEEAREYFQLGGRVESPQVATALRALEAAGSIETVVFFNQGPVKALERLRDEAIAKAQEELRKAEWAALTGSPSV